MKVSYNWLKQYLTIDINPDAVAHLLTSIGLEVEEITAFESVRGGLKGVVTGKVLECSRHPNAERLHLTKVDIGESEPLSIVCGAPNVAVGQKVLVAKVGTTLYADDSSFEIKKTKIRGEVSEGMICSEKELGIGESHEGIKVLDDETIIGLPASDYFQIETDTIFEVAITPNRSDATSHIGVARDLTAALNHRNSTREYSLKIPSVEEFKIDNHQFDIDIEIANPDACLRYSGLTISNLKVDQSPDWLKNKLQSIGLRPVNSVVDITNYVLFETGQPLHAFDANAITQGKVVVQTLAEGTPFVTLDGIERKLTKHDLMICNGNTPMCIGGVFGGLNSGVTEETTAIFLESACFESKSIRKTARHHGLHTDASFRFERGSDPEMTIYALKRAAIMIQQIAGGQISSEIKDLYPGKQTPKEVELKFNYLNKIAGQNIPKEASTTILSDLGIELLDSNNTTALFRIPSYKVDVYRPADLVEEVLRVFGYDQIAIPEKLNASITNTKGYDPDKIQHSVADMLASMGLHEIMNNSLIPSDWTHHHPAFKANKNVGMLNPLSKDLNVLRQSLLFGGLHTIEHNQNRKHSDLKLFEFGKVYTRQAVQSTDSDPLKAYHEQLDLAIFITGLKEPENWSNNNKEVDFFDLKFYVEAILKKLRIANTALKTETIEDSLFEYGTRLHAENVALISMGKLTKETLKQFDIKKTVYYASICWEQLMRLLPEHTISYLPLPKYPAVRRDLALVVDKSVTFSEIESIAKQTEKKILKDMHIFDIYEGEKIAAGKKSYAVSFTLLDEKKTLTDPVIEKSMQRLLQAFEQQLGAVLR